MGGFPSGQRDQTVNLTRKLRWFESTSPHHNERNCPTSFATIGHLITAYSVLALRALCNGKTSAFQADDAGSIPAVRSNV